MDGPTASPKAAIQSWHLVLAPALLALGLRLVVVWLCRAHEPSPDALEDYLPMAQHVLAGEGFLNAQGMPDYERGPGYALFLAAVQSVGGSDLLWVRLGQAVVDTATTCLVCGIGARLFSRRAGTLAAFTYAINPLAIWACALINPETLFAFLTALSVWFLVGGLASARPTSFLLCGVALGLAALCRATPLLLPVVWVGLLCWIRGPRNGLAWGACAAAGCLLTVSPWTVRNAVVFHELIPVSANGGANFYAGSSPRFWGSVEQHFTERRARRQELIDLRAVPPQPEADGPGAGDRYLFQMGLANYRLAWEESRLGVLRFLVQKAGRLWYGTQSRRQENLILVVNGTWLLGAAAGLVLVWPNRQARGGALLLVGTVAYFVLVLTALFPLSRYVTGFLPVLCVFCGFALTTLWAVVRGRN